MSENTGSKLIIRQYTPSDKDEVIRIYRSVWGEEKASHVEKDWDWKYHQNPYRNGDEHYSFVAEKDGVILAFVGMLPVFIKVGEITYSGISPCDLMSAPDHRGMTAIRLLRHVTQIYPYLIGKADNGTVEGAIAYKLWEKFKTSENIIITTVPFFTKRIHINKTVAAKTGSELLGAMANRIWSYFRAAKMRKASRGIGATGISVKRIDRFLPEHAGFLKSLMKDYKNLIVRTVDYLNWRFCDRPGGNYALFMAYENDEPLGFAAVNILVQQGKINGRIVDLMARGQKPKTLVALLAAAEEYFSDNKVRFVTVLGPTDPAKQKAFFDCGYMNKEKGISEAIIIGRCPANKGYHIREDWYYAFSDSDLDMD